MLSWKAVQNSSLLWYHAVSTTDMNMEVQFHFVAEHYNQNIGGEIFFHIILWGSWVRCYLRVVRSFTKKNSWVFSTLYSTYSNSTCGSRELDSEEKSFLLKDDLCARGSALASSLTSSTASAIQFQLSSSPRMSSSTFGVKLWTLILIGSLYVVPPTPTSWCIYSEQVQELLLMNDDNSRTAPIFAMITIYLAVLLKTTTIATSNQLRCSWEWWWQHTFISAQR